MISFYASMLGDANVFLFFLLVLPCCGFPAPRTHPAIHTLTTESKAGKPDDISVVFYQKKKKLSQIEASSIREDGHTVIHVIAVGGGEGRL